MSPRFFLKMGEGGVARRMAPRGPGLPRGRLLGRRAGAPSALSLENVRHRH
jgi:hypothetical protein